LVKRELEVNQIVRIPGANKAQKMIAKEKLDSIKKVIQNGGDFEEIAKKVSEDYVSGKDGGNLGWQQRGSLVPQFEATVFRLKPNELSDPIESEFGFHLIKLHERRGNEFHSSHILIKPNPTDFDLEVETKFLDSLRNRIMIDSIKFEKAAKEYSHDKNTAPSGGVIMSQQGVSKNFDDEIDSYVYLVVSDMEVGKISTPKPYRTDDGKMGVRILLLKSNTPPHELNLKEDYQKIYNFALSDKKNKTLNDWFMKAKDELYIKVDDEFKDCVFFQELK
jgi:peptidyl-prolyl cis-trans isomerase SurA